MTKIDIFESFNARYLSFEDIAKTFISNSQYDELVVNSHILLLGPRGSGKTTLLKMLTPPCQYYVQQHNPSVYRDLGFIGVYIPTDIQWQRQMDVFSREKLYPEKVNDNFPKFLVTTNILICLINTLQQLIEINFYNTEGALEKEVELSKKLINSWDIERPILPSLETIKQALYKRLKEGNNLLKRIRYEEKYSIETLPNYFYDDYFDLISLGCTAFEDVFPKYRNIKWALCFDELEISPEWLQLELLQRLRSTDQRFIFKLTTSPIVSIVNQLTKKNYSIEAREDEDYRVVRTWNHNVKGQRNWNLFAENLIVRKICRVFGSGTMPKDIFGEDNEERNLKETFGGKVSPHRKIESLYQRGGYYWLLFRELAISDKSFRLFLEKKDIEPLNPEPRTTEQKDQVFRKILQVVLFRFHFLKAGKRARSRKNPALYYGVPTIYELCDGNPRFLIGLVDSLLLNVKDKIVPILSIKEQSLIISDFSRKYLDLIASHPDSNKEIYVGRYMNLATLLKEVGAYFNHQITRGDFKMDVCSTFIVDSNVSSKILELIELGVHLGAIIYLEPKKVLSEDGLRGKKLRLSYLLHPFFTVPKREYKSVTLSTILNQGKGTRLSEQLTFKL